MKQQIDGRKTRTVYEATNIMENEFYYTYYQQMLDVFNIKNKQKPRNKTIDEIKALNLKFFQITASTHRINVKCMDSTGKTKPTTWMASSLLLPDNILVTASHVIQCNDSYDKTIIADATTRWHILHYGTPYIDNIAVLANQFNYSASLIQNYDIFDNYKLSTRM